MIIFAVIFIILGSGSIIYGVSKNNNIVTQFESPFGSETLELGIPFIIDGCIIVFVGVILIIARIVKSKNNRRKAA